MRLLSFASVARKMKQHHFPLLIPLGGRLVHPVQPQATSHERKVLCRNSFMGLQTRHGEKQRFFRGFREPVASLQNARARLQTRNMSQAFALFSFGVTMPTSLQAAARSGGAAKVRGE